MVAKKLARACYHMLKRGEVFDVTRAAWILMGDPNLTPIAYNSELI